MGKYLLYVLSGFGLLALIFLISVYGFGFMQRETADFRGETGVIEDTQAESSYRIASYEHFYNKCSSVQSLESRITNMEDELSQVESEQRKTVLNASITASKNRRSQLINSYNADARKEGTMGQFRSSDLPYQLDESEEITTCQSY